MSLHAHNIMTQFKEHAPKIHFIQINGWNEGSLTRSSERFDWDFTRYNQRLELEGDLFHFLTSLTQEKNHAHDALFHFLTSLTQVKELYSWGPISFFNKVT